MSRPTWARGLKLEKDVEDKSSTVAPHVGAWIETFFRRKDGKLAKVAPHVGAWIETYRPSLPMPIHQSRPTWARGLKLGLQVECFGESMSRPTWARGLKQSYAYTWLVATSRPTWARGLKHDRKGVTFRASLVAPHVGAWIETPILRCDASAYWCRAPRGRVD